MAKIRKNEMIEMLQNGAVLTKKFDRMYGTYFYFEYQDKTIWNVHQLDCKSVIVSKIISKKMIDVNTFQYTIN